MFGRLGIDVTDRQAIRCIHVHLRTLYSAGGRSVLLRQYYSDYANDSRSTSHELPTHGRLRLPPSHKNDADALRHVIGLLCHLDSVRYPLLDYRFRPQKDSVGRWRHLYHDAGKSFDRHLPCNICLHE
ncbi:hypothetical protein RvY_03881-4 [Ramazzottius varieornatus]|uniref:Uncharacterized protein n=1 Tax=Ramazzottius varieornatus TaxID=947166 RepID=A0A1D1UQE6_RAMVA|nr:hypothetical protein RvY_03881-4 [Ramazzottius varieornatus]